MREKLKGSLTISRISSSIESDYIEVRITDDLSRSQCVSARISLAGLAEALTGRGYVECEFDFRPELVGMTRENKEEFVSCENTYVSSQTERGQIAAKALAPFEVYGWKGQVDDLFNQHRRGKGGARVTFVRYIPTPENEK